MNSFSFTLFSSEALFFLLEVECYLADFVNEINYISLYLLYSARFFYV